MPLSARELHQRGVDAANSRRFAQARRALAAASARTDDDDLRARIDGTLAYVLAQTGEPAEAERLSREALARPGLSAETIALANGQLGTLLMHGGRLDEADVFLTKAIDGLDEGSIQSANLLMSRSIVSMQRHRLDDCTADLQRAITAYEAHDQQEPLAEARHNLGYAALLGGDLVAALGLMTSSRPILAATSDLAAAISDLDRAEVLRDAGLTTEAEELLGAVATQFGAQRMRQARGEAEFHLARSLLRHDAPAAERAASTASRRFAALGSEGWAARAEAVRLEARLRARPTTPPVADEFARTAEALTRGGFRTEAVALSLTARLADGGRMPRLTADAPTPLRLRAHEVRAARASAAGRHTEARRAAAEGLDLLTAWQQSFGALDLQASVAMHGTELMFTGLAAAARAHDPEVLFDWSERARHLSQQVAPVRPPHDADLSSDLAELRMLRADLAGSDWTTDARVRELRDRVRDRQWSSTGAGGSRERLGLLETQARLDDETAILAYVFTREELLCVVVTASGSSIVELSLPRIEAALDGLRADLDVAALTHAGPMASVVQRSLDERLRLLDDALLAPARAAAGGTVRLALTVPGILGGIPWAMLPGMRRTPFTIATSVSRLLGDSGQRTTSQSASTAGFAAGPRVARADEEVRRAASAWSSARVVTGDEARVSAVTELAAQVDVLHIAAHGRHAVDNPLFSGFELADGTLFGYDVDLIPHAPDTVILSACELGRSSVRWGEEALGMTRVWLHAGTRCVIAAPVVVADDVACELLGSVHTQLARGVAPAVALAAASESTGLTAPFQCHGSGL
ncbi:tetratricopeptide (TPR) repeat protein [Microbacterium phyllosphaerae]|uniref:Tetratricopeptide (TPR) repeat protein n=1 Tax=Microbacterium phyllosphaerae TaxID=124798 RepID=A0ABS4WLX5_9MICO|nr:CHAT domain-containing protein [Microbacterium phyllosphaerae]MBP2377200.1 tetratricopeptide (TPR) repeat protein [Microbacterium phyllosphaerae]